MSVIDWQILNDVEAAVTNVSGINTVLTTVCESKVDIPASGFPAALVLWKKTVEASSGADSGELSGRVHFVIALVVRDAGSTSALESALTLADAVRDATLTDPTRSGLASATQEGPATELGPAEVLEGRKPPLLEVRLEGSCGYFVSDRGN